MMNYIFFGTPNFAAMILEKLIGANLIPKAVVCNPDRPVGRKKIITPPPVKLEISNQKLESKIPILQPENPSSLISHLSSLKADFFLVAAYSKILSKEIIRIPKFGTIGVHPSLLPQYRGATPIQTAILNGDLETGATLYLIDEKIDHGAILTKRKTTIENRNYLALEKHLAEISANLIIETLPKFLAGTIKPIAQNHQDAVYTKKFRSEDGYIESEILQKAQDGDIKLATDINRRIRAFNPEPGVWTTQNGKRIKLLEAKIQNQKLQITKLQVEGKKPTKLFS